MIITNTTQKAIILNSYYAFVLCCECNTPEIKLPNSSETSIFINIFIRKLLTKIGRNKSVGPDGVPGEILK
jgi:hypothetical protein